MRIRTGDWRGAQSIDAYVEREVTSTYTDQEATETNKLQVLLESHARLIQVLANNGLLTASEICFIVTGRKRDDVSLEITDRG